MILPGPNPTGISNPIREPLAIIGVGCRLPGGASDLELYWKLLCDGVDAISEIPGDRFDLQQYYDADPDKPGKMYARQAGLLKEGIQQFDPLFFGIPPKDAAGMDPQQRILLETTWEAIEDAGLRSEELRESDTGVFIGAFCNDYQLMQLGALNLEKITTGTPTGMMNTAMASRISHAFDFRGPCLTTDTACSSSLVAVHLACQSIWNGECGHAIAGGANFIFKPEYFIALSAGRFLSPQSRCRAFDEQANGYARGEGAGVIIIKPLSSALEDGDPIHALIRGSGVNQDGRTAGMSLPNPQAQQQLMEQVLSQAGIEGSQIDYVEAHGTGTQAGDPAEAMALNAVLQQGRKEGEQCLVGSVKTNFGHLEAAAGIAGLIKATLCLKHRMVPPNLHFHNPNPKIPFERYCLKIPTQMEQWPHNKNESYAAINSFGFGGTNAHVILQGPPALTHSNIDSSEKQHLSSSTNPPEIITLGTRSEAALKELAQRYCDFLNPETNKTLPSLKDFAFSTTRRRSQHPYRLAVISNNIEECRQKLQSFVAGDPVPGLHAGQATAEGKPPLVFVYSGMGPQWWAMGRELMETEPVYRQTIERCDKIFTSYSGWSLLEALNANENDSRMERTEVAQPTNFALQAALTNLWRSWGIEPDAVVGHSVGEVAAAYACGALSLEDALLVSYHRSRLQQQVAGGGTMLAAGLSEEQAHELLQNHEEVSVAALNGASMLTLAGTAQSLQDIATQLEAKNIFNRFLKVEVAYHSVQMNPLREPLLEALSGVKSRESNIPYYSTVSGMRHKGTELNAPYWWKNVRQPVRLNTALDSLTQDGYRHFVEVGPHPVLSGSISESLSSAGVQGQVWPSLRRKHSETSRMLESLGSLYTSGFPVNWENVAPENSSYVALPKYPWQWDTYWWETKTSRAARTRQPGHAFLKNSLDLPHPAWKVELNEQFFPYLKDHQVQRSIVFPGAAYVDAGLALSAHLSDIQGCTLEDIQFERGLVVESGKVQHLQLNYQPKSNTFSIHSRLQEDGAEWTRHATAKILPGPDVDSTPCLDVKALRARCQKELNVKEWYEILDGLGLRYGPCFQGMKRIWVGHEEMFGELEVPDAVNHTEDSVAFLHPTLLDAGFQAMQAAMLDSQQAPLKAYIPVSIEQLQFFAKPGSRVFSHGRLVGQSPGTTILDLDLFDENGKLLVRVKGLCCRMLQNIQQQTQSQPKGSRYEFKWQPTEQPQQLPAIRSEQEAKQKTCIVFGDRDEWQHKIVEDLRRRGFQTLEVTSGACFKTLTKEKHYQIAKEQPQDMARLFKEISTLEFEHIIYLWGLPSEKEDRNAISSAHVSDRCLPLIQMIQACANSSRFPDGYLGIITRDAQTIHPKDAVRDPSATSLWGLGRVIGYEHPNLACRMIDLSTSQDDFQAREVMNVFLNPGNETEWGIREGKCYVQRLNRSETENIEESRSLTTTSKPVTLKGNARGHLNDLCFQACNRPAPATGEVEVQVEVCSLNFKDVLKSRGLVSPSVLEGTYWGASLGMECSGKVTAVGVGVKNLNVGDEVAACATINGFSSYVCVPASLVFQKPEHWCLEELPISIPMLTAMYGLLEVGRLQKGEKVLIHNASGGVGLAAVQIAQWKGATVYATAGSEAKRTYLRSIGVTHVMNSRRLDFANEIKESTHGKGVDVVLNAMYSEALFKSFELLAPFGRFVEIGKKDISENNGLPMSAFNRNLTFSSVDIDRLLKERPERYRALLRTLFAHYSNGDFKPLPVRVFPASQITDAFREMSQSKHIGKIAVRMMNQEVEALPPEAGENSEIIQSDATYLVSGGTGGFGLETIRWLATKGARHLVMISRRGATSKEAQTLIAELKQQGIQIKAEAVDVTNHSQMKNLLAEVKSSMPPLRGIIHSAMVLDDALLTDLNSKRFNNVLAPKIAGVANLHALTKEDTMDFFVMYSSISSMLGNIGQGSYAAANAFLDGFASYRRGLGLPATTLNWGVLAETGVVSRSPDVAKALERFGVHSLTNKEALDALEEALNLKRERSGVFDLDWERWANANPVTARSALFRDILEGLDEVDDSSENNIQQLIASLSELEAPHQIDHLAGLIKERLSRTLHIPESKLDVNQSLNHLGMDSLTVVDLATVLHVDLGIELSTMELMRGPSVVQLAGEILERLALPNMDDDPEVKAESLVLEATSVGV